jgi:hypothetical protein
VENGKGSYLNRVSINMALLRNSVATRCCKSRLVDLAGYTILSGLTEWFNDAPRVAPKAFGATRG